MPVEDVFSISGRGTVVTGRVESGEGLWGGACGGKGMVRGLDVLLGGGGDWGVKAGGVWGQRCFRGGGGGRGQGWQGWGWMLFLVGGRVKVRAWAG